MTEVAHQHKFGDLTVQLIPYDGDFWVTGEAVGVALEYPDPLRGVSKVFQRNRERLEKHSTLVKLTTVEGGIAKLRAVRVFNEEGVMIITMLSRQPKAVEFQDWAVQILKAYRHGELALSGAGERDHLLELCLRESGRGNVAALHTLVTRYGYPQTMPAEQTELLKALKGAASKQLPLPM